jgi:fatty aldehyde decarbonylase
MASQSSQEQYPEVFSDILSQAVTGELIGMANYGAMCRLLQDAQGLTDAVEHAASERGHAAAFERAAADLGVSVKVDVQAPYWKRIREAFLRHVDERDAIACLVIQEVMLESFAVSMYHAVADVATGKLGKTFRAIGDQEEGHIDHAIDELRSEFAADPSAFEAKVESLHNEVMTILAEMMAAKDTVPNCGLCRGTCVKESLHLVGLDRATLRGLALNHYLKTLDRIGVPGEKSLAWVARLPL